MQDLSINWEPHISYTKEEHSVWHELMTQQLPLVAEFACKEYLLGLQNLQLPINEIPQVKDISDQLEKCTGWILCSVDGLLDSKSYFNMLANKQFPVVTKIRKRAEIDFYTDEAPDIFHEIFGHCPLLTNSEYAKTVHKIGLLSLKCNSEELSKLANFFWATFEFGLIQTNNSIKAYGAGILPSKSEILRAVKDATVSRLELGPSTVIQATLHGNIPQPVYYVISSFSYLYNLLKHLYE